MKRLILFCMGELIKNNCFRLYFYPTGTYWLVTLKEFSSASPELLMAACQNNSFYLLSVIFFQIGGKVYL